MRSIQVSLDVFQAIWSARQPGRTADSILRGVFKLPETPAQPERDLLVTVGFHDPRYGVKLDPGFIFPRDAGSITPRRPCRDSGSAAPTVKCTRHSTNSISRSESLAPRMPGRRGSTDPKSEAAPSRAPRPEHHLPPAPRPESGIASAWLKLGPNNHVHCLKDMEERNSDHVFPELWYPDSTPPDLEKWQIPSCIPCNSEYGKLEQDFLVKVGLCLNPHHPASKSIVEKSLRSLKAAAGRNPHDAQRRLAKGRKILAEALQGDQIPEHGVFPGLDNRWSVPGEEPVAILVSVESLQRITEKIVRGIHYIEDGVFIRAALRD